MIIFELNGNTEAHPVYKQLQISNGDRQRSFLESLVEASLQMGRPFFSHQIIKALNYHAICCLHVSAGEYRNVEVTVGPYKPPGVWQVQSHMDDFIDFVNLNWLDADPIFLATYVLWRLNHIHPFINGNGRTARALCYYVLCQKAGGWLPGSVTLMELLVQRRTQYVTALAAVDKSKSLNALDLNPLFILVQELLAEQLKPFVSPAPAPDGSPGAT